MPMNAPKPEEAEAWHDRCAQRLQQIDPELPFPDARRVALDLWGFERTRAMPPEAAADFVSREMQAPRPRFERRASPR